MLDIKFIRENPDLVKEAVQRKHVKADIDRLIAIDEKRRAAIQEIDELRASHKKSSDKLMTLMGEERENFSVRLKEEKNKLSNKEYDLRAIESEFEELMLEVPNIPDPSVPDGVSDKDNQEIKSGGEKKSLKELGGRDYLQILKDGDMADFERGVKVSGFRGYFLKNDGARLSLAIWQFALEFLQKKRVYRSRNPYSSTHLRRS